MSSLNRAPEQTDVTVFRDDGAYIPLSNVLKDDDAILLLTPVVVPPKHHEDSTKDPFECFGRAVAARHPRVRHVPYTAQGGITDYHTVHISMARTVIFVISGAPIANQPSQIDLAHTALASGSSRPCIVVVCYGAREWQWKETGFPTIVQVPCCSPAALETTAAALFGEDPPRTQSIEPRQQWLIEVLPDEWSQFDISPIEKLWKTCLPPRYHLSSYVLRSLLDRGGFSRHYAVKSPDTGQIIGFCATYTTFINSDNTELVGSLAMLLVEPTHRGRGIGLALHGHALSELKKTRGVRRLQLGSTFPRLWYGIPENSSSIEWFRRRRWTMDLESDGQGRTVSDWVLNIGDWPSGNFSAAMEGFTFRICHGDEHEKVMQFIKDESVRDNTMGLHDEYAASAPFDIVLGLYGTTIVATALTYFPRSGTQAEMDLPWAASIGYDVGGVTCICIAGGISVDRMAGVGEISRGLAAGVTALGIASVAGNATNTYSSHHHHRLQTPRRRKSSGSGANCPSIGRRASDGWMHVVSAATDNARRIRCRIRGTGRISQSNGALIRTCLYVACFGDISF